MARNDDLAQIIAGCKKGSPDCFSQLLDTYAGRCYGYFYRLTANRDTADELLAQLFVKLVEKINLYKTGSFDSWLFKVASNIFNDYLRLKQRQSKLLEAKKGRLEAEKQNSERSDDERIDKLQTQLNKLNQDTRQLIMLRFYSQLSFAEIAKMRAEPIGTTLSKLHRGLKKLRHLMEQE